MLKFVVLLTVVAGVLGGLVPEGLQTELEGRIVQGQPGSISSFPYQISLQTSGRHFCGGSIIDNQTIVTAAHCVVGRFPQSLSIRAGSSEWKSGGVLVAVKSLKIHENYDPKLFNNDIAVLRLNSSLPFSSTIRSINLATFAPTTNTMGKVSGWGTTQFLAPSGSPRLLYVDLKILSREDCGSDKYYYGESRITESMVCTYDSGKDACQGDSGGPLVALNELVGVVSWGAGCGFDGYPGVYTDVAFVHDWILEAKAALEKEP